MARFSAIINQFNGGMVTQRMSARNNLDMWPKSCREVVNFIPTVWGGNKFRGGTRYVDEFGPAHFIPFIFNNDIAYAVAFGNNVCRFYRNNKPVLKDDGTVLEVMSPYSYTDITGPKGECLIKYQQSADVLYLATGRNLMYKLLRASDNDFYFEKIEFKNGPFEEKKSIQVKSFTFTKSTSTLGTLKYSGEYVFTDDLSLTVVQPKPHYYDGYYSDLYFSVYRYKDTEKTEIVTGKKVGRIFQAPTDSEIVDYAYREINSGGYGITAEKSSDDGRKIKIYAGDDDISSWSGNKIEIVFSWTFRYQADDYSASRTLSGVFSEEAKETYSFPENYLGRCIRLFINNEGIKSWAPNSSYSSGQIVKSDGKYYACLSQGTSGTETPVHTSGTYSDGSLNWTFVNFGYIDGTINNVVSDSELEIFFDEYELYDWYSTYGFNAYQVGVIGGNSTNYPSSVFFFNERLGIGINTDTLPKVCFSQSGDYENFDPYVDGEVVSESAVTVDLAVGETDTINWCTASSDVIVATDSNFTIISPATTSEPFGPDNIKIDYLSSDGANIVNPVQVGKKTMYIDEKGKSLFSNGYDWESNGFRNIKASWIAEDLFEEGIIGLAYQRDPDFSVWALTAKGNLICFTYEPDQNVSAFSYHYTDGVIKSICAIPSYDGSTDELWISVERTAADGSKKQFVEVMQPGLPLNIDKQGLRKKFSVKATQEKEDEAAAGSWFVDCGIEKTSEEPFTEVDGLSHLEGKEVYGLADGNFVKARVVKDGKIALDKEAKRAIIGLPYEGYFIPNGIDTGAQNGTSQAKTQRISQMTLRVYRSCDFKCGDGYREQNIKLSEGPDGKISLFTGDYRFAFPGTYSDRYNKITSALVVIKQDKPFPLCVNGLVANMETIDG